MGIIFESTWNSNKKIKWSKYSNNQWQDFALVVFENDTETSSKAILNEYGKVNFANGQQMQVKSILVDILTKALTFENESEMGVSVFVSTTNFYEMLIYQIPWYDRINFTIQNICKVLDSSFRFIEEQFELIERNLDLEKAIELLNHYESVLGITTNNNISYKQRRNQIKAVFNSMFQQANIEMIKELCSAFSNNNSGVEVLKTNKRDTFEVRFVSGGLPNELEALKEILYKNIPAHIELEFTFTKKTWKIGTNKGQKRLRWRDVTGIRWNIFNVYEG